MREGFFEGGRSSIGADLDRTTEEVIESLGVDFAMFSVKPNEHLGALGLEASYISSKDDRTLCEACLDEVNCLDDKAPVVEPDAGWHPMGHNIASEAKIAVAGCLAVPVYNGALGPIGVIFGISSTPRAWTEIEVNYLKAVSAGVGNLIACEKVRIDATDARKLASDYDEIISAFSLVRAAAASIHDALGQLVFANRALSRLVEVQELAVPFDKGAASLEHGVQVTVQLHAGCRFVATPECTPSGYFVCHWTPEGRKLN